MSITVLMTTYNCAPYISQAIRSVLKQTYKDFELLIIDDGSTDETERVVADFKDSRIRYIIRQHFGMATSLNFGLMNASNDFIALMDADDISDTNRLERQLKCHSKNPNEINFTSAAFFKSKKILFIGDTKVNAVKFNNKLALHGPYNNATAFFNKRNIIENGGYNESLTLSLDHDLWLRLKDSSTFVQIPEILYFIRLRKSSLSNEHFISKKNITYQLLEKYYGNLSDNFKFKSHEAEIKIKGWREYFYGSKFQARSEWNSLKIISWDFRILTAYLISFLPENIFNNIKSKRIRYRVHYWFKRISNANALQKRFDQLLTLLND